MRSIWDSLKNLFLGPLPETKSSSSLDKPDTSDDLDKPDTSGNLDKPDASGNLDKPDTSDDLDHLDNFDASGKPTKFETYLHNERLKTKRRTIDQVCNQMAKEPYWQSLNEEQQSIVKGKLKTLVYTLLDVHFHDDRFTCSREDKMQTIVEDKVQQLETSLRKSGVSKKLSKSIGDEIRETARQIMCDEIGIFFRARDSWLKMMIDKHVLEPVNDDNINVPVDWWCWALTGGGVTEAKLYKRLHLHLDAAGSLATKIVNGKPEPCVTTDTYVANRDLELPPFCGAASVTVYAKPNVKVSQYGHSHNKVICRRQIPEDLPFLRGDIAEGVRVKNKEAGDIIDRAAKIEGILDQVCDTLRQLEKIVDYNSRVYEDIMADLGWKVAHDRLRQGVFHMI